MSLEHQNTTRQDVLGTIEPKDEARLNELPGLIRALEDEIDGLLDFSDKLKHEAGNADTDAVKLKIRLDTIQKVKEGMEKYEALKAEKQALQEKIFKQTEPASTATGEPGFSSSEHGASVLNDLDADSEKRMSNTQQ